METWMLLEPLYLCAVPQSECVTQQTMSLFGCEKNAYDLHSLYSDELFLVTQHIDKQD